MMETSVDVTGVELKLLPMALLSGVIVLEPSRGLCQSKARASRAEIVISARRTDRSSILAPQYSASRDYGVDDGGRFTIPFLYPGNYRLEPVLPDENWYLKSIAVSPPPPSPVKGTARAAAARAYPASSITLKSGERVTMSP